MSTSSNPANDKLAITVVDQSNGRWHLSANHAKPKTSEGRQWLH
jgi:hypothetical protein